MNAATFGQLMGGLMLTYTLTRLGMLILKKWNGGYKKIFSCHALSLTIIAILGGYGFAQDGGFAPLLAISKYLIPQLAWLAYDLFHFYRKKGA